MNKIGLGEILRALANLAVVAGIVSRPFRYGRNVTTQRLFVSRRSRRHPEMCQSKLN